MTEPKPAASLLQRRLAWTWLLVVALLLGHNAWLWLVQRVTPDTDILTLLPSTRHDDTVQQAFSHMVDSAQQKVVVLIGAKDWEQTRQAATAYEAVSASKPQLLQTMSNDATQLQSSWLASFDHSRLLLLSAEQRRRLQEDTSQQWGQQALANLYGAFGGPRLGTWQDDPFGLFSGWVQERAQETPVRPRDGHLSVESGGRSYVLLLMHLQQPAFSLSTQEQTVALLAAAERAAHTAVPDADIMTAGVILHAAAASSQASNEMTTIGAGSLIGILLLMWLSFRSFRPIALIALSIAIGCLGALSVCWLLFGRLHLLTLVFGASLVGIAQDYAIYFLCARLGADTQVTSRQLLWQLLPGLSLMLLAAVIGYLGMAATPFPGLRQMAVFSVLGLLFAWLTVLLWFPALIHSNSLRNTALAQAYGNSIRHWPHWNRKHVLRLSGCLLAALLFIVSGFSQLSVSDDIRALQKTPQHLLDDQIRLGKILDMPNPAQFYLVRGDTTEQVLQREEQLRQSLQPLIKGQLISGVQAVSNWVPSLRQQQANRDLIAGKLLDISTDTNAPLATLASAIDENRHWQQTMRQRLLSRSTPLVPQDVIDAPAGQAWRHLWLGQHGHHYASIVAVRGIRDYHQLPTLAALASGIEGVLWVDKVADISAVLREYRHYMSWALVLAYGAIFLLLSWRYRGTAWRIMLPPLSATLLTLALFGLTGQPLQLFHVLACMLLLGLGVDYGIFLQEPSQYARSYAWLTVGLSAVSALLSFGLLALSNSPPLHAFGLTMLIGMTLIWLLSPCFMTAPSIRTPSERLCA